MSSADLVEWLNAQIAEDERVALGEQHAVRVWIALTPFRERFDPARVLAECEAKKKIIARHQSGPLSDHHEFECTCGFSDHRKRECACGWTTYDEGEWQRPYSECPTLRLLALPFADRPGYQEEWRP